MKFIPFLILLIIAPNVILSQTIYKTIKIDSNMKEVVIVRYEPGKLNYNYKNCILKIKAGEWTKKDSRYVIPITVVIINQSKDTLNYLSDSSAWPGYFSINSDDLKIDHDPASKMISSIISPKKILLYGSKSMTVHLTGKNDAVKFPGKVTLSLKVVFERSNEFDGLGIRSDASKEIIKKYNEDVSSRTHIILSNVIEI